MSQRLSLFGGRTPEGGVGGTGSLIPFPGLPREYPLLTPNSQFAFWFPPSPEGKSFHQIAKFACQRTIVIETTKPIIYVFRRHASGNVKKVKKKPPPPLEEGWGTR
jgi:hypothetical protein